MSSSCLIENPILRGFNPDPSICRVGEDYYIATSTFQWFPGVQIHHSRDLVHWRLLGGALTRRTQLDMLGVPDSGGIWAPCLTYNDGKFWLIFTNVSSHTGAFKDTPNYLVTAEHIEGPWSDPISLNASGFDPSLFHAPDGRKWLLNMVWDHRPERHPFAGIVLQEYDVAAEKLVGPIRNIFKGSELKVTEGPHLYFKDGWYHLIVAEGGTGWEHAVTHARSRDINGPYEVSPFHPLLTSAKNPKNPLQKAGHASIVEAADNEWYLVHLCSRPLSSSRRCMLGRETAIQACEWTKDGWLKLRNGSNEPAMQVPASTMAMTEVPPGVLSHTDTFESTSLSSDWATLRLPPEASWLSLTRRKGALALKGQESLSSLHRQSLVGRRVQSFHTEVETSLEFSPDSFQQAAGLLAYYDTTMWYYLSVTYEEGRGRILKVVLSDDGEYKESKICVGCDGWDNVFLRASISYDSLQFAYSENGSDWVRIGENYDASKLSDDYGDTWKFTGAFYALAVQDLSGQGRWAYFNHFAYRELPAPSK